MLYILCILALSLYVGYLIYGRPVSFGNIFSLQSLFLLGYGGVVLFVILAILCHKNVVIHNAGIYFGILYLLGIFSIVWASNASLVVSGIYFSTIPFLFIFTTLNTVGYQYWKMLLISTAIVFSTMVIMTYTAHGGVRFVLPINANTAVFGILPALPFLINSYYQSNSQIFRLFSIVAMSFSIISLILTRSRTPILIIAFFLFLTAIVDHNNICGWDITRWSRRSILIVPVFAVVFPILMPGIIERYVASTIQLWEGISTLFTAGPDQTEVVSLRAKVYFAIYTLLQRPEVYLHGVGFNNFSVHMGMISDFPKMNPHNFPLRILMELGIPGFICLVLGVSSAVKAYASKITSNQLSNEQKGKYVSGLWGLAFVLLLSLFNPLLLDPIFFILLSLPYVITQEIRHTSEV